MSDIRIDVQGREKLDAALKGIAPRAAKTTLTEAAEFALKEARRFAKPHAADKGTIANAMEYELDKKPIPLFANISPQAKVMGIAQTINDGRSPGKPPPAAALQRWSDSHGYGMSGWHLQETIRAGGTKGVQFMEQALAETEKNINQFMDKAMAEVRKNW